MCGADKNIRFSPHCWLSKFALLHKNLEFDTVPLSFQPKSDYPDPEYGQVPVLRESGGFLKAGSLLKDSAEIVAYLEKKYPKKLLVQTDGEMASVLFYKSWLGSALYTGLAPMMFKRVCDILDMQNQEYFRKSREQKFGVSLEELAALEDNPRKVEAALSILVAPLTTFDFLGGSAPNLADYTVASPLMWQHCVTSEVLYETPPEVAAWMERILNLFDGYAGKSPRAHTS